MGGMVLPAPATEMLRALSSDGESLEVHRLSHVLVQKAPPPDQLRTLLNSLTYLAAHVHGTTALSANLRALIDTALRAVNPSSFAASPDFLVHLLSVDVCYVDPVLSSIVPRLIGPDPSFAVHLLAAVLARHKRSGADLVLRALATNAPHPINPLSAHSSFLDVVFGLCEKLARVPGFSAHQHFPLVRSMLALAFEKLAAIQLMTVAPDCADVDPAPEKTANNYEKLAAVVLRYVRFVKDVVINPDIPAIPRAVYRNALCALYEAYVLPVTSCATSALSVHILTYLMSAAPKHDALHHHPAHALLRYTDALRQMFHDGSLGMRLRIQYLNHSAFLLSATAAPTRKDVLKWLHKLTIWLNAYLDSYQAPQLSDSLHRHDLHTLYHAAIAAVLRVLSARPDVLDTKRADDIVTRLRMRRVLFSRLRPLRAVPPRVALRFAAALKAMLHVPPALVAELSAACLHAADFIDLADPALPDMDCPLGTDTLSHPALTDLRSLLEPLLVAAGPQEQKKKDKEEARLVPLPSVKSEDNMVLVGESSESSEGLARKRARDTDNSIESTRSRKRVRFSDVVDMSPKP